MTNLLAIPSAYEDLGVWDQKRNLFCRFSSREELIKNTLFSYPDIKKLLPFLNVGFDVGILFSFPVDSDSLAKNDARVCYASRDKGARLGEIALDNSDGLLRSRLFLKYYLDAGEIYEKGMPMQNALDAFHEVENFLFEGEYAEFERQDDFISLQPFVNLYVHNEKFVHKNFFIKYTHEAFQKESFGIARKENGYFVAPSKKEYTSLNDAYEELKAQLKAYRLKSLFV
jgi:hypothetical protein